MRLALKLTMLLLLSCQIAGCTTDEIEELALTENERQKVIHIQNPFVQPIIKFKFGEDKTAYSFGIKGCKIYEAEVVEGVVVDWKKIIEPKIKEGVLKKVVLSRKRTFSDKLTNPITVFEKLLQTYTTAFVYLWYHPKVGLWLGATPETLLEIKNRTLHTMSLAGTQRYNAEVTATWGAKEKEEQQLVTDTIVARLKPLTKELLVGETQTHKAGNILHLKTNISARLDETKVRLHEVIAALHPTPAVCGLPVERAKQFILEKENYDRSYYTGFLGELNLKQETNRSKTRRNIENLAYRSVKKQTHLFVNLRCMEHTATGTHIYVGGGITEGSIPEAEWEETKHKLETMGNVLF